MRRRIVPILGVVLLAAALAGAAPAGTKPVRLLDVLRVNAEKHAAAGVVTATMPRHARAQSCDVVIIGGGTGGTAAALAATGVLPQPADSLHFAAQEQVSAKEAAADLSRLASLLQQALPAGLAVAPQQTSAPLTWTMLRAAGHGAADRQGPVRRGPFARWLMRWAVSSPGRVGSRVVAPRSAAPNEKARRRQRLRAFSAWMAVLKTDYGTCTL